MKRDDGSTLSRAIICDYKHYFRQICEGYFALHSAVIGGPGQIVEIDETVITKRKYHRGQLRAEEQWFIGGRSWKFRGVLLGASGEEKRRDSTSDHRSFRSPRFYSDHRWMGRLWRDQEDSDDSIAREGLRTLRRQPLRELRQPRAPRDSHADNRRNVATVQGSTQRGKGDTSYIYQFLWRKKFKGPDVLYHLWMQIAEIYPCEQEAPEEREEEGAD